MNCHVTATLGVGNLPRKAPTEVIEQRITFGNYERQFVTEVKNDIEKSVKLAAVTTVAVPVVLGSAVVGGLGLLGYGLYRGLDAFSFGKELETLGCTARKYVRAAQIFGWHPFSFVDSCEEAAKFTEQTPYNPDTSTTQGSPIGADEMDFIGPLQDPDSSRYWTPPYGEDRRDSPRTSRGGGSRT